LKGLVFVQGIGCKESNEVKLGANKSLQNAIIYGELGECAHCDENTTSQTAAKQVECIFKLGQFSSLLKRPTVQIQGPIRVNQIAQLTNRSFGRRHLSILLYPRDTVDAHEGVTHHITGQVWFHTTKPVLQSCSSDPDPADLGDPKVKSSSGCNDPGR
jgi:hypothetical protein